MKLNLPEEDLAEISSYLKNYHSGNWITVKNAARYSSVSESTIRRAVKRGELKVSRVTGKLLFKITDIDRWLNG